MFLASMLKRVRRKMYMKLMLPKSDFRQTIVTIKSAFIFINISMKVRRSDAISNLTTPSTIKSHHHRHHQIHLHLHKYFNQKNSQTNKYTNSGHTQIKSTSFFMFSNPINSTKKTQTKIPYLFLVYLQASSKIKNSKTKKSRVCYIFIDLKRSNIIIDLGNISRFKNENK